MTPRQAIETALGTKLRDEAGKAFQVDLAPPATHDELAKLGERLGAPPPPDVRDLLRWTSGFAFAPLERVDLLGRLDFELADIFPRGLPIAGDGCGNFWVVDVHPRTGAWGAVFYACHDPPVVALQSPDLGTFLEELFRWAQPGAASAVKRVPDAAVFTIWSADPDPLEAPAARGSADPAVAALAKGCPDDWRIFDLRNFAEGKGFAWGRTKADVRRDPDGAPIFATERPKPGFFARLFGLG